MKKISRVILSLTLAVSICFQTVISSFASTVIQASTQVITPNGTLDITQDSIIIDGNTYSKEQFLQALSQLRQLPDTPQRKQIFGSAGTVVTRNAGTLYFVGQGISSVFWQIAFALAMSTLVAYCINRVFVIEANGLPNLTRDIKIIIKDADSIYIDGVRVGFNWVTYETSKYIDNNKETIGEIELSWDMFLGSWTDYEAYGEYSENISWINSNLDKTVAEILKSKRGNIKNAPKQPGDPSWETLLPMTLREIKKLKEAGDAGYGRAYKLLTDGRFNK